MQDPQTWTRLAPCSPPEMRRRRRLAPNADPAAEIPLVAVTLGATMLYREGAANPEIAAAYFFLGPMITALPATACLTAVRFPLWRDARIGVGFHEISARPGEFAFAAAAA